MGKHITRRASSISTVLGEVVGLHRLAQVVRWRNVVEGVNAVLKGEFVNVGRKFLRVFRLTKLSFLLAFTIAGYNVECTFVQRAQRCRGRGPDGGEEAPQEA